MKTRIIQTKIWSDSFFASLNKESKILFFYLITNQYLGMTGAFELSDRIIMFDTGLSPDELRDSKDAIKDKIHFVDGWIIVKNSLKYNNYASNPKQRIAYAREYGLLPEKIKSFIPNFGEVDPLPKYKNGYKTYKHREIAQKVLGRQLSEDEVVHHIDKDPSNNDISNLAVMSKGTHIKLHSGKISLDDSSIIVLSDWSDSTHKTENINNKSEIINKERVVKRKQFASLKDITPEVIQEIAEYYHCSVSFVNIQFEKMKNWLEGSGKVKKNYKATLRNFVLSELEKTNRGARIEIGNTSRGSQSTTKSEPEHVPTAEEKRRSQETIDKIRADMKSKGIYRNIKSF